MPVTRQPQPQQKQHFFGYLTFTTLTKRPNMFSQVRVQVSKNKIYLAENEVSYNGTVYV